MCSLWELVTVCIYVCLAGLGAYTLCNVGSCAFYFLLFVMSGFLQLYSRIHVTESDIKSLPDWIAP